MALVITKVFHKPDGGVTRTEVERHPGAGDGHQAKMLLEKHLKQYPESGHDKDGPWARDADGRRYTFDVTMTNG